jgi:hypothetical protein
MEMAYQRERLIAANEGFLVLPVIKFVHLPLLLCQILNGCDTHPPKLRRPFTLLQSFFLPFFLYIWNNYFCHIY